MLQRSRRLPAELPGLPPLVNPGMVQDTGVRTDVPRVSGRAPGVAALAAVGGGLRGRRKPLGEETECPQLPGSPRPEPEPVPGLDSSYPSPLSL